MRKVKNLLIVMLVMSIVSMISLLAVSVLVYQYKWQADKALIGITITYILTGFAGGLMQKRQHKAEKNMGRKMMEAIFISLFFMLLLIMASIFAAQIPFVFSSRFLMIFMLLTGSTCLGRIL